MSLHYFIIMLTANQKFIDDVIVMCGCFKKCIKGEKDGKVIFEINLPLDDLKKYLPDVLISIIEQYIVNEKKLIFTYNIETFNGIDDMTFRLRLRPFDNMKNNYGISYLEVYTGIRSQVKNIVEWSISMENLNKLEKCKTIEKLANILFKYKFSREKYNNVNPIVHTNNIRKFIDYKYIVSTLLHKNVFQLIIFLRNLLCL